MRFETHKKEIRINNAIVLQSNKKLVPEIVLQIPLMMDPVMKLSNFLPVYI